VDNCLDLPGPFQRAPPTDSTIGSVRARRLVARRSLGSRYFQETTVRRRHDERQPHVPLRYAGEYESVDDAKADLKALKELHREHAVGTYDAAVVTKNEKGKVKVVDKIEKPTQHGGWAGLAVGAAIGLVFPPSILVSGLAGAGAGALIGHLRGGMSRDDLKEIGEMLDESEAALIVVGEATIERAIEEQTKRAKKAMKKQVEADAKEMERAIDAM
jgi:uncharacterized membrane protein